MMAPRNKRSVKSTKMYKVIPKKTKRARVKTIAVSKDLDLGINSETQGNGKLKRVKDLNEVERAHLVGMVMSLRVAGVQWTSICKKVEEQGFDLSLSTAHRWYHEYLAAIPRDAIENAKSFHLMRLENLLTLSMTHYNTSGKKALRALELNATVLKQVSELLDLDAPVKVDIDVKMREVVGEFDDQIGLVKARIIEHQAAKDEEMKLVGSNVD